MMHRFLSTVSLAALLAAQQACGPAGSSAPPSLQNQSAAPAPAVLKPGDAVPDETLTGHDGQPFSLASRQPRMVLLTFIFTRCSAMEFCPRMSQKFTDMRRRLDATSWKDSVELVSVTLDPEHDTAEVLAAYARGVEATAGSWTFATCPREVLDGLQKSFGVRAAVSGATGATEHNLVTVLIDGRGRLLRTWEGNTWAGDEVIEALSVAAGK